MFKSLNLGALSLDLPFEEGLRLAREHGFAALDLPPSVLTGADMPSAAALRARYASAAVRPGGWALPIDFRRDEEAFRRDLADLPRQAALAGEMSAPWCFTWILPYSDELDYAANMERHAARLRQAARILAEHGCRLALEFVGPATLRAGRRYPFIRTIAETQELVARIDVPGTGLLLDCWHWYTSHASLVDIGSLSEEAVVYVHVNDAPQGLEVDAQIDNQRLLPGDSGVIDVPGFLRALAGIGYDGPVVVEPFNAALVALAPEARAAAVAASLARAWAEAGLPG